MWTCDPAPRAASIAPKRKRLFTPGLSGDARQSEAGSAWEIGPLEERNVAEMSYEVDVLFKGAAQWHPHYVGGHERAPQRICIRDIVVMPTTSSFA